MNRVHNFFPFNDFSVLLSSMRHWFSTLVVNSNFLWQTNPYYGVIVLKREIYLQPEPYRCARPSPSYLNYLSPSSPIILIIWVFRISRPCLEVSTFALPYFLLIQQVSQIKFWCAALWQLLLLVTKNHLFIFGHICHLPPGLCWLQLKIQVVNIT